MAPNVRKYSSRHKRRLIEKDRKIFLQKITEPDIENLTSSTCSDNQEDDAFDVGSDVDNENVINNADDQESFSNNISMNSDFSDLQSQSSLKSSTLPDGSSTDSESNDLNISDDDFLRDAAEKEDLSNVPTFFEKTKLFIHELRIWSLRYKISLIALTFLLLILRKYTDHVLPKDSRTILKTPKQVEIFTMVQGEYCHFSLFNTVSKIIDERIIAGLPTDVINLTINIDGLPLYKSKHKNFWLILCSDDMTKKVFLVGAFCGKTKPNSSSEFLSFFRQDIMDLTRNGFQTENGTKIQVNLYALICDTPAKSFALNVKSHSGYGSCTKCKITGKWIERNRKSKMRGIKRKRSRSGCVCFPPTMKRIKLRTDEEMAQYNPHDDYQKAENVFSDIPRFGLITCVPLDYMHLILLGVVKRLIWLWIKGPLKVRRSPYDIKRISKRLEDLKSTKPREFKRRPRPISEFGMWKAVEFRQFLLYTGPIVLKGILPDEMYSNFLALHVATTILLSPQFIAIPRNIDYAESLLKNFVQNFANIYGEEYVSPNVHSLQHICDDVRKYGVLDNFSAFKFENHMSAIKRLIRKPHQELQQLVRRSAELEAINSPDYKETHSIKLLQGAHSKGPLIERNVQAIKQFKKLTTNSYAINCRAEQDTCIRLKDGSIVQILNIVKYDDGQIFFVGKNLKRVDSLYKEPIDSKLLNIVQVSQEDQSFHLYPIKSFQSKMWRMELNNQIFCFSLLHVESDPFEDQ